MATHSNNLGWKIPQTRGACLWATVGLQVGYSLRGLKESDTTEHTHSSETVKISGAVLQPLGNYCQDMEGMPGPGSPQYSSLGKPLLMLRRNSHPGSQEEQLQGLEVTPACGPQPPGLHT